MINCMDINDKPNSLLALSGVLKDTERWQQPFVATVEVFTSPINYV